MYQRILLAYDGSSSGQKALLESKVFAQWAKASISLLAVIPVSPPVFAPETGFYDKDEALHENQYYQEVLKNGIDFFSAFGLQVKGDIATGDPVTEIVRYAETLDADLVIVGHKHQSSWVGRWWGGQVSKSLIEHSPCNVLVVVSP